MPVVSTSADLNQLTDRIIHEGYRLSDAEAYGLAEWPLHLLDDFLDAADRIRAHFMGDEVHFCSLSNVKSGNCHEECGFCAQSAKYETDAPTYPMKTVDQIKSDIDRAARAGATEISLVASGTRMKPGKELDRIIEAIQYIRENTTLEACTSLGLQRRDALEKLKEAGMSLFHHNLETARSYFPEVVKTHSYDEEIESVRHAKELGLTVCCGGILGMGETRHQRVELALTLRDLNVDHVPLNFLNPIKGTALGDLPLMDKHEALHAIALYRFILPTKKIFVLGGREVVFQDVQDRILRSGANGILLGNYLTTSGRSAESDLEMIAQNGLRPASRSCHSKDHHGPVPNSTVQSPLIPVLS